MMHAFARRLIILGGATLALTACGRFPPAENLAIGAADSGQQAEGLSSASAVLERVDALRGRGELVGALSLLAEAHGRFPRDNAITSAYGRVALALGHEEVAGPLLEEAVAADPRDWRALSAKGVLESRRGRLPDGRLALVQASKISASEAVILNNLAVSHLLDRKPAAAVSLLRQGLAAPELRPQHERRLTRNLALALAMQGRFDEADKLAGETLPRALAQGDMTALRRLLGINGPRLAGDASGWKTQTADASRLPRPALQ